MCIRDRYEIRYCVKSVWKSLGMLVSGKVGREDVAGPVGIAVNVGGKTYDDAKQYEMCIRDRHSC